MKSSNTASRLKEIMETKGLRQVDILTAAKPFCEKCGIKLGRNDLSQYVSGKVEPGSDKLTILGLALDVSETWLMGYDVDPARDAAHKSNEHPKAEEDLRPASDDEIQFALFGGRDEITEKMYEEVKQFAAFLKQRDGYNK